MRTILNDYSSVARPLTAQPLQLHDKNRMMGQGNRQFVYIKTTVVYNKTLYSRFFLI